MDVEQLPAADEQFLVAHVSRDGKTVGIDHPTTADWNDVRVAHVALRDRINERLAAEERCPVRPKDTPPAANAKFYYFKASGKFYTSDRGVMPDIFGGEGSRPAFTNEARREAILRANQNKMPGLSTTGSSFRVVVIIDDAVDFGYPLCLEPLEA